MTTLVPCATVADRLAALEQIAACAAPRYSAQLWRVDASGQILEDLTPWLLTRAVGGSTSPTAAAVTHDSTAEVSGRLGVTITRELAWGVDRVQPVLLARPDDAPINGNPDAWWSFPLGQFIVTSPGNDNMDHPDRYVVTGYDPCYLLQNDPVQSFAFAAGSAYGTAVRAVLIAAGIIGSGDPIDKVCDFPPGWYSRTLSKPLNFPLGGGANYLQVINQVLAPSSCRNLYADPFTGRYVIETVPTPATQPLAWRWAGGNTAYSADLGYPQRKIVLYGRQQYNGDAYNRVNQWVFVQSGLTFTPIEGSGRYTVNDEDEQARVGRIIRKTVTLTADGQTDLTTQGDKIATDDKAKQETVVLQVAPWPAARHFDVFQYTHPALPNGTLRRVQAQQWTLPLNGAPMEIRGNVVGAA